MSKEEKCLVKFLEIGHILGCAARSGGAYSDHVAYFRFEGLFIQIWFEETVQYWPKVPKGTPESYTIRWSIEVAKTKAEVIPSVTYPPVGAFRSSANIARRIRLHVTKYKKKYGIKD